MARASVRNRTDQLLALSALAAPGREAVYAFVASRDDPVGRDETASALRIGRPLVAFHLEKLVDVGLLDVASTSVESPRARGRPAKRYRRAAGELAASLPPRSYGLFGRILGRAVARRWASQREQVLASARAVGREVGEQVLTRAGRAAGRRQLVASLTRTLGELGYEPRPDGGTICLRNCPFEAIATEEREVTCAVSFSFLEGVARSLGRSVATPVPNPGRRPEWCCVSIRVSRA